jgi:chromosome segregation ATPase
MFFCFSVVLIRLLPLPAESCGTTHATPHAASEQNLLTELIQTKQVLHDREANLMLASEIGQALVDRLHRQQQTTQEIADERDELHAAIPQLQSELHTYREYIEDLKQRNAELLGLRASGAEATALSTEELDLSVDSIASISSLKSPDSRNMRRWASASTLPNLPVPTTPDDSLSEVEEV